MTRVHLKTTSGVGDYINASFVDVRYIYMYLSIYLSIYLCNYIHSQGYKHRSAFLATQAPLETTVGDFWRMIWDQWSPSIVMLYTVDEEDANEDVCLSVYLPFYLSMYLSILYL